MLILLLGVTQRVEAQGCAPAMGSSRINVLSTSEKAAGWRLLFDGESTKGWRGYRKTAAPAGWRVVDGALTRVAEAGDLVTEEEFGNFELSLEWKIITGGNSGVLYRVSEAADASYETGPEMQVLDDANHPDGQSRATAAGSAFGLYPAPAGVVRPAGQWNSVRIVVTGNSVEHWLNDVKVVSYQLGSPEWSARVAASKFHQWPGYGRATRGYIALQDHEARVSFRNIKIRVLP
ncbi:MAG: DUF1080 domain-containing protein [Gemmatimonadota bacterium]